MAMIDDNSPRIALRIIVEGSIDAAREAWLLVRDELLALTPMDEPTIRPYWKFPGSCEISCTLRPEAEKSDGVYEEVTQRLGSGWAPHTNDQFARWTVWNRGVGTFITPSTSWAHLELIRA